jgi:hypothetical protein
VITRARSVIEGKSAAYLLWNSGTIHHAQASAVAADHQTVSRRRAWPRARVEKCRAGMIRAASVTDALTPPMAKTALPDQQAATPSFPVRVPHTSGIRTHGRNPHP